MPFFSTDETQLRAICKEIVELAMRKNHMHMVGHIVETKSEYLDQHLLFLCYATAGQLDRIKAMDYSNIDQDSLQKALMKCVTNGHVEVLEYLVVEQKTEITGVALEVANVSNLRIISQFFGSAPHHKGASNGF
eukprot:gene15031-17779_t